MKEHTQEEMKDPDNRFQKLPSTPENDNYFQAVRNMFKYAPEAGIIWLIGMLCLIALLTTAII